MLQGQRWKRACKEHWEGATSDTEENQGSYVVWEPSKQLFKETVRYGKCYWQIRLESKLYFFSTIVTPSQNWREKNWKIPLDIQLPVIQKKQKLHQRYLI